MAEFRIPKPWIPDSTRIPQTKITWIPDSGFRISLHGARNFITSNEINTEKDKQAAGFVRISAVRQEIARKILRHNCN